MKTPLLCVVTLLSLCSCASSYKPVILERLSFGNEQITSGVEVSYSHNVQARSRNGWYAKKEKKFGFIAVAVKVINNTEESIELSPRNLRVYASNGDAIRLLTPMEYAEKVHQRTGRHLLHALYGPWIFVNEIDASGNARTNVFILPVGAVVGIYNALRASKANRINVETLNGNAIWNKWVDPGETVHGTILIAARHGDDLVFRFDK